MAREMPRYKYSLCPLPHRSNSSRVLRIHPSHGNKEMPLVCDLFVMPNDDASFKFEALSWTWGQAGDNTDIVIEHENNSYSFEVSKNLEAGLKVLRRPDNARLLWCDQICIDQDTTEERNAQVASMTNIYGKADNICIWLGVGDHESNRAIDFIEKEVMKLGAFGAVMQQTTEPDNLVALQGLMNLPWFSRRWVVQEITLAKAATLYCGDKQIPWNDFADAVTLCADVESLSGELSVIIRKADDFGNVPRFYENVHELSACRLVEAANSIVRRSTNSFSGPPSEIDSEIERFFSLEYLVSTLSGFESSNPRDTVYALLSIAKDSIPETSEQVGIDDTDDLSREQQRVLRKWSKSFRKWGSEKIQQSAYIVSYEQPEIEVWKEFIRFVVRNAEVSRCLDILCRSWAPIPTQSVRLPSWICTVANRTFAMSDANPKLRQRMERRNANPLVGLPEFDQGNYKASGLRTVRPNLKFENCEAQKNVLADLRKRAEPIPPGYIRVTPQNEFESLYISGFQLDTIETLGERSQSGNIPGEWFDIARWSKGETVPDDFWRTIVANRRADGRPASRIYPRLCGFSLVSGAGGNDINISELMTHTTFTNIHFTGFLNRVQSVIFNRRMMRSTRGYLGLLPRNTKVGDLICILGGCSVPVVLRRHKKLPAQKEFQSQCRDAQNRVTASIMISDAYRRKTYQAEMLKAAEAENLEKVAKAAETLNGGTSNQENKSGATSVMLSPAPKSLARSSTTSTEGHEENAKRKRGRPRLNSPNTPKNKRQRTDPGPSSTPKQDNKSDSKAPVTLGPQTPASKKSSLFWYPEPDDEYYQFIGECYVHGMMNGEALKLQSKELENGDKSMQNVTFELR